MKWLLGTTIALGALAAIPVFRIRNMRYVVFGPAIEFLSCRWIGHARPTKAIKFDKEDGSRRIYMCCTRCFHPQFVMDLMPMPLLEALNQPVNLDLWGVEQATPKGWLN